MPVVVKTILAVFVLLAHQAHAACVYSQPSTISNVPGGNTWIDGGGLPPVVPAPGVPPGPGNDRYFGDPVLVVDKGARAFGTVQQDAGQFYYASIYQLPNGTTSLSVNRGRF